MDRAQLNQEFKNLLDGTIIPSSLSDEEIQQALDRIRVFVSSNVPKQLFRFRSVNLYSIMSFEHNTITLCDPDFFSDKFDSVVYIDKGKIEKDVVAGFDDKFQKEIISEIRATGKMPKMLAETYGSSNSDIMVQLYSQASEEEIMVAMENNKANLKGLLESIPNIASEQVKLIRQNKQTKIACFTESVHSKYMWDIYASGYKGFALEYDLTGGIGENEPKNPDEKINPILLPVVYSDTMYDATNIASWWLVNKFLTSIGVFSSMPFPDILYWYKAFLFKDITEYSIEKEWRFMCTCHTMQNESFLEITCGERLKAIYYGPYIEPNIKAHLHTWALRHNLKEYDVVLNNESNKFDLTLCELN